MINRSISVTHSPVDLATLKVASRPHERHPDAFAPNEFQVVIGSDDTVYVTAEQALAISEAWRSLEQQILERLHGVEAVR